MNEENELKMRYVDFLEETKKINRSIINDEKRKARIEGLKEGKEEGLKQGIEKGIEKNKKEIILNMYNEMVDLKLISKYTNISIDEIKKIIDLNKKDL